MILSKGFTLDTTWRMICADLGISACDVLRSAKLSGGLLTSPSVTLSSEEYYRLWSGMEAQVHGRPLPLLLCETMRAEAFSPALFAALCSPNLTVAAQRIARFKPLIAPLTFAVTVHEKTLDIVTKWPAFPSQPPASLVAMELVFAVFFARTGTRRPIVPASVTSTVLPDQRTAYEAFLGTRLKLGTENRIAFHIVDAKEPFLTSNDALWATFEPDLRRRLSDMDGSERLSERVHGALLELLPSGESRAATVATRLGLSQRTLQRKLLLEETSFQMVLSKTRYSLACHYLQKTTLSIAEISFLLGFAEPNSFHRAFREWSGVSPDAARKGGGQYGMIASR